MADDPNAHPRRTSKRVPDDGVEDTAEPSADGAAEPSAEGLTETRDGSPAADGEPLDAASIAAESVDAEPVDAESVASGADVAASSGSEPLVTAEATTVATLWDVSDGSPTASPPWLHARSPDDRICPYLRAVTSDDRLGFPVESPDAMNRCASMREAVPQSLRQQELVCLTANHVNCPRYLRGASASVSDVPATRVRPKAVMTPAISAALIILTLSFGASVAFGLANGGLAMPSPAAVSPRATSPSSIAAGPTASPVASRRASASPGVSPSVGSIAASSPSAAPNPTASPTPGASPVRTPTPSAVLAGPTPSFPSSRAKLLKPCPNKPNCWIYTVHAGDNLFSIAKYFGVPLSKVKSLNPWTKTDSLRAGRKLILPNPTR